MLIGGIVVNGQVDTNSNKIKIKIPQLFGDYQVLDALVCNVGGLKFNYPQGTAVIVGFYNHDANRPIVLGSIGNDSLDGLVNINANSLSIIDENGNKKDLEKEMKNTDEKIDSVYGEFIDYISSE